MGEVAADADFAVLTAEDPRTERADDIIEEIASGLVARGRSEGHDYIREPDAPAPSPPPSIGRTG